MKIISAEITGSLIINNQDVTTTVESSSIWSGSIASRVTNLEQFSSSLDATFATDQQLNQATASLSGSIALLSGSYLATSGSYDIVSSSFSQVSGSFVTVSSSYSSASGSLSTRVTTLEAASASLNTASGSFSTRTTTLEAASASLNTASGSFSTRVTNNEATGSSLTTASGSFSTRVTKIEGNYATTGSNIFLGAQTVCANITSTGTIIAQTLNVQQVTSSIVYSSGSNIFGCSTSDVQQMTGSVRITGSLNVTGNACITSVCSPTFIGGTVSGTTVYASTVACSPIGCFATSCATSFIGGTVSGTTISGTTIYGSTNLCGPSVCTTDGFHCSLRMACRLIPFSNYRTSDCGYGGIDFFDNGKGYACSAKFYTFKTGTEYYGFTNDYNGNAQLAAVSCGGGGGENISFFTGTSTTARLRIDNNASCFSQTICTPTVNAGRIGIGINAPTDPFYVCCLNSIITHNGAQGWSLFRMYACNTTVEFQIRNCVDSNQVSIGTFSNTCLKIRTSNADRVLIDNTGIACFACQVCAPIGIISTNNSTYTAPDSTNVPNLYIYNTNNASTNANSLLTLRTNSGGGGNPFISFDIAGVQGFSMGMDNADGDKLKIANSWSSVATNTRITIDPNGITCFSGLVCTPSGHRFGNGSTTLNYYEEGSWTPVFGGLTVGGTTSYAHRSGTYVRIGNWVLVRWGFKLSSTSGAIGTMSISGLPFAPANYGSYQEPNVSVSTGLLATADYAQRARVFVQGPNTVLEGRIANNADTAWNVNEFSGDEWIIGEVFYNT